MYSLDTRNGINYLLPIKNLMLYTQSRKFQKKEEITKVFDGMYVYRSPHAIQHC